MNGDKFVSSSKNLFRNSNMSEDENNFFVQNESFSFSRLPQTQPTRHINDYDANILREGAYKEVSDEVFKLEYKINKIEDELTNINKKIQMAEEIYDYFEADKLKEEKTGLLKELALLKNLYNEASISAKISDDLISKIREKFICTVDKIIKLFMYVLSKFPGKISSIIEIRHSLAKLENINKSVDELMKSRYPYGEAAEKYNQLSKYIARANSIQSEIYGFMK